MVLPIGNAAADIHPAAYHLSKALAIHRGFFYANAAVPITTQLQATPMINHKLVLPGHLNQYGYLFGGNLLKWVDEYAWIAATLDYPGANFVTIAMDRVEFRKSIQEGAVLRFEINRNHEGRTSVQYAVTVFANNLHTGSEELVFSTTVIFVRIDQTGKKIPLR